MDSYDEIPYHSTPFTETHPVHLAVIGRLFGLETPDPDTARVLELGCASGGNLIPMAWHLPWARFEGVELSARQARAGADLAAAAGLENVHIRQGDILDLDPDLGQVDYLIAHGVYSWVPEAVQARILALAAEHLSPSGVAYISYNTLPGWRMRGMLRDALLHHVRRHAAPGERLAAAGELLERLDGALEGVEALSARYLRQEIAYLRKAHPSYLYHEYLEALNEPLLLTSFVARAAAHGLQYLGDTDVQSMFPWSLGERTEALVQGLEDQVEQEQYLDFVRNRTFRQTLLCRAERPLERVIDLERLDRFAACSALEPPRKLDLRGRKPVPFRTADGRTFEVRHQLTRSALLVLGRAYPNAVPLPELRAQAAQAVAQAGAPAEATETDHLFGELFSLFAHGAVVFDTRTRHYPTPPPGHPRASALARVQAAAGLGHLATARHSTLSLDPFAARLVGYLDGSLGREDLVDRLVGDIRAGRIAIEGPAASAERLRVQVAANCDRLLALFGRHGVLSDRPA